MKGNKNCARSLDKQDGRQGDRPRVIQMSVRLLSTAGSVDNKDTFFQIVILRRRICFVTAVGKRTPFHGTVQIASHA